MRKAFADTMLEVGMQAPRLVVLVGDISHFALQPFSRACPGRYYNVGILEPTIVSMAAGLAHTGLLPVVHTIAPFLIERSFEQIKLDFCYQQMGGTLVSVGSAFDYSGLGCSHHCYNDMALVKVLPNTEVIYPASSAEFDLLFKQTYANGKLTYFRLPGTKHGVQIPQDAIRVGKGIIIKNGQDVTLLGTGPHLKTVLDAVPILSDKRIDAEVIYYPCLKPFDQEALIKSCRKTKKIVVIEEHCFEGGFGEEVLRVTCNEGNIRYAFICIPNQFQRGYGSYSEHKQALGFTAEKVASQALKISSIME